MHLYLQPPHDLFAFVVCSLVSPENLIPLQLFQEKHIAQGQEIFLVAARAVGGRGRRVDPPSEN